MREGVNVVFLLLVVAVVCVCVLAAAAWAVWVEHVQWWSDL